MDNTLVYKSQNGQAVTNSQLVADAFGKTHKNVVRDIEEIFVKSQNWEETDFKRLSQMFIRKECKVPLNNGTGAERKLTIYLMTRDGFTLLAMGYNGERAMRFKLQYIEAFNRMEQQLQAAQTTPAIAADPTQTCMLQMEVDFLKKEVALKDQIIDLQRENIRLRTEQPEPLRLLTAPQPIAPTTTVEEMETGAEIEQDKQLCILFNPEPEVPKKWMEFEEEKPLFEEFARKLFCNPDNVCHPVSIREILISWHIYTGRPYKTRDLTGKYSRLRRLIHWYCNENNILVNPTAILRTGSERSDLMVRAACYTTFETSNNHNGMRMRTMTGDVRCFIFYPMETRVPITADYRPLAMDNGGLLPEMIGKVVNLKK